MLKTTLQATNFDDPGQLRFQEKSWLVERTAWVLYIFFIVLAFAGFFGRGFLSQAKAGTAAQGMQIEYERFMRAETPFNLKVQFESNGTQSIRLWISRDFFKAYEISSVTPEPEWTHLTDDGAVYVFSVVADKKTTPVIFSIVPGTVGRQRLSFRADDKPELRISQFVYP